MTNLSKTYRIAIGMWALVLSACSEISLEPATDKGTTSATEILADGSIKDTFLFNRNGNSAPVDVLFIDDNSQSMAAKQLKLGNALNSFITSLGTVSWQIGITTTDTSDGLYGLKGSLLTFDGTSTQVLTSSVPNYAASFLATIQRSELGSGDERGMQAIIQAIGKRNTDNAGFFRNGADLAVVMLSDEDEASDGNDSATKPAEVIAAFQAAFGKTKNITVYGILIAPIDTACYNSEFINGAKYANVLSSLVNITGGTVGSICDADYSDTLTSIGSRVRQGVRTATLSYEPEPGVPLKLEIIPADPTLTWTVTGRVVLFNKPPQKGTKINVVYKAD